MNMSGGGVSTAHQALALRLPQVCYGGLFKQHLPPGPPASLAQGAIEQVGWAHVSKRTKMLVRAAPSPIPSSALA